MRPTPLRGELPHQRGQFRPDRSGVPAEWMRIYTPRCQRKRTVDPLLPTFQRENSEGPFTAPCGARISMAGPELALCWMTSNVLGGRPDFATPGARVNRFSQPFYSHNRHACHVPYTSFFWILFEIIRLRLILIYSHVTSQ